MMIDESMQGLGYGSAALDLVIDYIKKKPFGVSDRVALTCNKDNSVARKLYEQGICCHGIEDEDEIEMVFTLWSNKFQFMWVMQQTLKQHPAIFAAACSSGMAEQLFTKVKRRFFFQIAMTMVCRDLPRFANGSKTTRFLLRFDY